MHIYYISGVPYSDELYHHGIKGQKWGRRLYQYEDGTLTPLGKIHYGISNAIANAKERDLEKRKRNNPSLMSDEELKAHLDRANMEKQYLQIRQELDANKPGQKAKDLVTRILQKGGETLALKAFEAAGNKIVAEQEAKNAKLLAKQKAESDARYSERLARQAAKNKAIADDIIDKAQRRQTINDASSIIMRETQKNFKKMTKDDIDNALKKYESLRRMENRYRGSNAINYGLQNNQQGGGKKKGG